MTGKRDKWEDYLEDDCLNKLIEVIKLQVLQAQMAFDTGAARLWYEKELGALLVEFDIIKELKGDRDFAGWWLNLLSLTFELTLECDVDLVLYGDEEIDEVLYPEEDRELIFEIE